jgi:proteic killer suppression protein
VIRSFADKDTESLLAGNRSRRLPPDIQKRAYRKLLAVHLAVELGDLAAIPSNRLERLSGTRKGQHSIRINDQWRICFEWRGSDAYAVEIVDYH